MFNLLQSKKSLKHFECHISANTASMKLIRRRIEEKDPELTLNGHARTTYFLKLILINTNTFKNLLILTNMACWVWGFGSLCDTNT